MCRIRVYLHCIADAAFLLDKCSIPETVGGWGLGESLIFRHFLRPLFRPPPTSFLLRDLAGDFSHPPSQNWKPPSAMLMQLPLLLLCCYFPLSASAISESLPSARSDSVSLLVFKSSISLDPSNLLAWWLPSTDHCRWYGVTCDAATGRVVALNITGSLNPSTLPESGLNFTGNGSFLAGTLTASISNLTELRILSLPHNAFSGEVPAEIGLLRFLEVIELQGNNFTGGIPHQISNLSLLRLLNLSCNSLTGAIPSDLIGSGRIRVVDLSNNQLSGEFLVNRKGVCEFLAHLKLSNNFLVGNIPIELGKCRNLRTLLLDGNILEGSIPPDIGNMSELRVLDVSRNSLTYLIPRGLGNCQKLNVVVLTNLVYYSGDSSEDVSRGEYNAFVGGIPPEIFMIPALQVLWAPRANIGGRLHSNWTDSCSLRILNLGLNYIDGTVPEGIKLCRNLTFLDLSSNDFFGHLPSQLHVPCMVYFNVSRNSLSGILPSFLNGECDAGVNLNGQDLNFLDGEDIQCAYSTLQVWASLINAQPRENLGDNLIINHDFSWNNFTGSLPLFFLADALSLHDRSTSYRLLLNNNDFNGSLPAKLFLSCTNLQSLSVNMSSNRISGEIDQSLLRDCPQLTEFEAAQNQIEGPFSSSIGSLLMLQCLNLRGNRISGGLPQQLGDLKNLRWFFLGKNNLTGEIPHELGQLTSMEVLDLSQNDLTGSIPAALANATNLEVVLLDHNKLSGVIPVSFSSLSHLTQLDVSFNNLTGHIPHLLNLIDCSSFKGNRFLHSCPDTDSAPPMGLPLPLQVHNQHDRSKLKSLVIATATSVSVVIFVLLVIVLALIFRSKRPGRIASLRRKMVVTFIDTPVALSYDNVVGATENFSIRNLIGTGGFGSTYKAEVVPGFLVAVKRLSLGRFQGIQQFEAEIRTLGRLGHKNLVTLIGYYVGDTEMFLIYNYLSGGNLETFIHDTSGKNVKWPVLYKIAIDIAQALVYLHYSCVPRIVHRDIKPSNILLDEDLNAYLSDFGLARLLEVSQTHATTDVAGTFGYVAPEYATTCRVSDKADVYSFGVVLLELMSGKKSLDPSFSDYGDGFNIVAWATLLIEEGRPSELFPPQLWAAGPTDNLLMVLRLALSCTVESLSVRPSMRQVLEKLKQLNP
ncbi:hypothetical protein Ancab_003325 [Ancistrocladus abbreviatus]